MGRLLKKFWIVSVLVLIFLMLVIFTKDDRQRTEVKYDSEISYISKDQLVNENGEDLVFFIKNVAESDGKLTVSVSVFSIYEGSLPISLLQGGEAIDKEVSLVAGKEVNQDIIFDELYPENKVMPVLVEVYSAKRYRLEVR